MYICGMRAANPLVSCEEKLINFPFGNQQRPRRMMRMICSLDGYYIYDDARASYLGYVLCNNVCVDAVHRELSAEID